MVAILSQTSGVNLKIYMAQILMMPPNKSQMVSLFWYLLSCTVEFRPTQQFKMFNVYIYGLA